MPHLVGKIHPISSSFRPLLSFSSVNFVRTATTRNFSHQSTSTSQSTFLYLSRCFFLQKISSVFLNQTFNRRFCTTNESKTEKEGHTLNYTLAQYINSGKYDQAQKLFETMKRSGVLNLTSWHTLLKGFSMQRKLDKIIDTMTQMRKFYKTLDTVSYNIAINCCWKLKKIPEMFDLYQQMEFEKVSPDSFTFNCMLKAVHEAGMKDKLESLLDDMLVRLHIPPNSETIQIILDHWAATGIPLKEIMELLKRMESHFHMDAGVHTALILALGKANRYEDIQTFKTQIEQSGKELAKEFPMAIIKAYGMNKKTEQVLDYFNHIASTAPPSLLTANAVLEVLSEAGDATSLVTFFNSFPNYNLTPSIQSWELLIIGLSKHPTLVTSVEEYLAMMEKTFQPTVKVLEAVIPYFLGGGAFDKGTEYFIKMINMGVVPRTYLMNETVKHLADRGEWEQVHSFTQLMEKYGTQLDYASYNIILLSMGNAGKIQEMQKYFNKIVSEGFKPTTSTYNTLIKFSGKFGATSFLLEYLKMMKEQRVKPDGFTMNHVLFTFLTRGEYSRCLDLYKALREQGAVPTPSCLQLVKKKMATIKNKSSDITTLLELVQQDVAGNKPP